VPANPILVNLTADFEQMVYQVTEGVYVAVGFARANPVLIEGIDGLIIVDPAESVNAAEGVKAAFNEHLDNIFDRKPVKAIIYTHYHDCHIHGASVFAGDDSPEIIAHETLATNLYSPTAVYGQIYPIKATRAVRYMGIGFQADPAYFINGGIFPFSIPGPSGYLPPTITVKEQLEITIAGVDLVFTHAPGETTDIIYVWLPEEKVLVQIGNFYKSFPAITTLRGASFRNPLEYLESIDKMRSLNAEYMVLIHGGGPIVGAENVNRILTDYRDGVQYVHDQTVRYMNQGLVPAQIIDLIELPPHLADNPFLREYFGRIDLDVYQIFLQYLGYFSGECRDIFPMSLVEEAQNMADLVGGATALAAKAEEALDEADAAWALKLADYVLMLEPESLAAFTVRHAAMLSLAEETYNAQARNYLLSEYLEETGQTSIGMITFETMDDNMVRYMPMRTLFQIQAVSLDASSCLDESVLVGLHLLDLCDTDQPANYAMHLRRGILEVQPQIAKDAAFTVITDSLVWKQLILGKLDPREAVSSGEIIVSGADPQALYDFLAFFD
jgi:alkyl sulfatase BDS1-like metallo-beta-lactamase superfamily hydrolase